jgi:hypothetical protein
MTDPETLPQLELQPGAPKRRGGRFSVRFSLLSLLIAAAIVCVAAAFYGVRRREAIAIRELESVRAQAKQQEETIERLRAELGYLTIGDKGKIHALQLPTHDEYHWKWRVYLPPERRWKLFGGTGNVPSQGYENVPHNMSTIEGGEFTLEVFIDNDPEGRPRLVYRTPVSTTRMGISPAEFALLKANGHSWAGVGRGMVQMRDAGQPIQLMRLRVNEEFAKSSGGSSYRTSDQPQFGFLIWIEEARPGE